MEAFHENIRGEKTNGGDNFINKSRLHRTWIYDIKESK